MCIALGIDRNRIAKISAHGVYKKYENNETTEISIENATEINQIVLPAMPFYIDVNTSAKTGQVTITELRLGEHESKNEPFFKYDFAKDPAKLKFIQIDHDGSIYAHHRCCPLDCQRQVFHRISGKMQLRVK